MVSTISSPSAAIALRNSSSVIGSTSFMASQFAGRQRVGQADLTCGARSAHCVPGTTCAACLAPIVELYRP